MEGVWLRSFPCIALRVLTVHDLLRHKCALTTLARPGSNSFPMRLSSPEKRIIIYFYTSMGTYLFFPNIFYLPFILFLFKELEKKHMFQKIITRNALLTQMKSRPREHARKEGFKSILSDASTICHKPSSKLFLLIDILRLLHCFKICFKHVLPLPTVSSVN